MRVQGKEFAELAVHHPARRTIGVLALDAEDSLVPVQRVQAVANTNAEPLEEDGDAAVALLIALEVEAEQQRGEAAGDELVGDVDRLWHDGGGAGGLVAPLRGDVRQEGAEAGPLQRGTRLAFLLGVRQGPTPTAQTRRRRWGNRRRLYALAATMRRLWAARDYWASRNWT